VTRPDEAIRVGALEDFPLDAVVLRDVGGRSIGVIRTAHGLYAIRNMCPHQGAPVALGPFGGTIVPSAPGDKDYGLDACVIRCPWHAWEFDIRTGEALFGTSEKRLVVYATEVRNDGVYVRLRPPARPVS